MRQVTFIEPGRLEWWDVDAPEVEGEGEALVEPLAVATCDLDTAIVHDQAPFKGPFAFGHECVARVVESAGGPKPGSLVSVPFQISCGECEKCRRGFTGNCTAVPRMSMYGLGELGGDWGGFLSDLVRVPHARHMLTPLPPGVTPEAAASVSDNLVDAWRTVGPQLEAEPGAEVLVVSATPSLGIYAAAIALALGASQVVYCDHDPERLARAEAIGAEVVDGYPDRLGPFPITVAVAADPSALTLALHSTAPDGFCTSASIFWEPETPVPLFEMYTKCVTLHTGRVHAQPLATRVLELMADGRLQPERVAGRVVPWHQATEALAEYREKLVISRPGGPS
jgi:threonine dehydrogenase-like Zn-dependent dehydrogenase